MKTINEYIKKCHQIAIEHGWWDTERSIGEIICLFHSEVSEILEEYRNGRKLDEIYYVCNQIICGDADPCVFDEDKLNKSECHNVKIKCKPEGIPIEFADLLIRIFDFLGHDDPLFGMNIIKQTLAYKNSEICEILSQLHCIISDIYRNFIYPRPEQIYARMRIFKHLISFIFASCNTFNIPIEKALDLKIEYNKTRSYRHGDKKC